MIAFRGTNLMHAALASGSVDATVLTSPQEFSAEKRGYKILVPMKELAKLARIPLTGMVVTQKKIDKESDEIIRVLRAIRAATLLIREQPEFGIALFEKGMRLDRASAKAELRGFEDRGSVIENRGWRIEDRGWRIENRYGSAREK